MSKSDLNPSLKQTLQIHNFTPLTQKAILKAEAEENNLTASKTPGFTDNRKLMAYMRKRAKELR